MNDIFPLQLDDNDWARIVEIIALPEAAREPLEHFLGYGRYFIERESSALAAHATKKRLADLRAEARSLAREIRLSAADPDILHALMMRESSSELGWAAAPPAQLTELRSLEKHLASIDSLANWFEVAQGRVPSSKKGDKTAAIQDFVKDVDWLLNMHTGKGLTRGYDAGEEFVNECFRHLGVEVKAGNAIRRFTSDRRGRVSPENS